MSTVAVIATERSRWPALLAMKPPAAQPGVTSSPAGLETWVAAWGDAAIFVVVLLGNIGVSVPEEIVLLVAGYLAWRVGLAVPAVIRVGVLSAVVGGSVGYWLGRKGGAPPAWRTFVMKACASSWIRRRWSPLVKLSA